MIEILMRTSMVLKLLGAAACAGLSIYNLVASSDQVLVQTADSSSSRSEVRVFESPSRNINLMSGIAFGAMFCGLVYFGLAEYNSAVEELGSIDECTTQQEQDHHQLLIQQVAPPQQRQVPSVYNGQPTTNVGSKPHLRLVAPITADGTHLIPPSEFMQDMEAEDYWSDNSLNKDSSDGKQE